MKLPELARAWVPDEEVLAAGVFWVDGAIGARLSFGEHSARSCERREREASGLDIKRYLMLVVTPEALHVFDTRANLASWRVKGRIARWSRADLLAHAEARKTTIGLAIEVPSENRRLLLEAPKARFESSAEVARLLTEPSTTVAPDGSAIRPLDAAAFRSAPIPPPVEPTPDAKAGTLVIVGGVVRILAYTMPWIVVHGIAADVGIPGYKVVGAWFIGIAYSIVIIVCGGRYRSGKSSARLLRGLGFGSVIAFGIQLTSTTGMLDDLQKALLARGYTTTESIGFGIWVLALGAALVLIGGMRAVGAENRSSVRARSTSPRAGSLNTP
jgi:hypothetical protein